jgi:hypothetical protein
MRTVAPCAICTCMYVRVHGPRCQMLTASSRMQEPCLRMKLVQGHCRFLAVMGSTLLDVGTAVPACVSHRMAAALAVEAQTTFQSGSHGTWWWRIVACCAVAHYGVLAVQLTVHCIHRTLHLPSDQPAWASTRTLWKSADGW